MAKTTIEIPDDRYAELTKYQDRLGELLLLGLNQIKIEEALYLYKKRLISFARGAELAGLPQKELMRHAKAQGIEPQWTEQMVEEELA